MPAVPFEIFSRIAQQVEGGDLPALARATKVYRPEVEKFLYHNVHLAIHPKNCGRPGLKKLSPEALANEYMCQDTTSAISCLKLLSSSERHASYVRSLKIRVEHPAILYRQEVQLAESLAGTLCNTKNLEHLTLLFSFSLDESGEEDEDEALILDKQLCAQINGVTTKICNKLDQFRFRLKTAALHDTPDLTKWTLSHSSLNSLHIVKPFSYLGPDSVYDDLSIDRIEHALALFAHPNSPHMFCLDTDGISNQLYVFCNAERNFGPIEWQMGIQCCDLPSGRIDAIVIIVDTMASAIPVLRYTSSFSTLETIIILVKSTDTLPNETAFADALATNINLNILQIAPWATKMAPESDWAATTGQEELTGFVVECAKAIPGLKEDKVTVGETVFTDY